MQQKARLAHLAGQTQRFLLGGQRQGRVAQAHGIFTRPDQHARLAPGIAQILVEGDAALVALQLGFQLCLGFTLRLPVHGAWAAHIQPLRFELVEQLPGLLAQRRALLPARRIGPGNSPARAAAGHAEPRLRLPALGWQAWRTALPGRPVLPPR